MAASSPASPSQRVSVVVAGHVDHGKSTLVGRLLADAGALPEGKLEQIRSLCERTGRPFEYAFLLDALKDERAQGITIDTARVFFRAGAREYLFLDAPGHVEFVRNLVTGAAQADAALLVIDAGEGIRDNSRRHGYLMGLLGIRQLVVVINKMDLVGYSAAGFEALASAYRAFLEGIGLTPLHIVPAVARDGDNLAARATSMDWYRGPTVLEVLGVFEPRTAPADGPFRMPVQDVYKFTGKGDARRIVAGTVESGAARAGDELVFYPSGKRARLRSLEAFGESPPAASAGRAAGFTLEEQIYVTRGEVATLATEPAPAVTTRLRAGLFWLGRRPLVPGRDYVLKLGTARATARVLAIHRALDLATLAVRAPADRVERHEAAECDIELDRAIAADAVDRVFATARFVLQDEDEIAGGGLVREALPDPQAAVRNKVLLRNYKWETGFIPVDLRAERYRQRPRLLLLTGSLEAERKTLAKALEARLFDAGHLVYYIGMASLVYGVDADLGRAAGDRAEHMRRLAEIANLLLDAGAILLVTASALTRGDLEIIQTAAPADRIATVWLGPRTTDLEPDLELAPVPPLRDGVERLHAFLDERGAFLDGE